MKFVGIVLIVETTGLFMRSKYKCEVREVGRDKITKLEHSPIVAKLVKSPVLLVMVGCSVNHPMIRSLVVLKHVESELKFKSIPWSDGLNAVSIVVRKVNRFQQVGDRPFVVAQEPVLEEIFEGCAFVVKTTVVDDEVWSIWDRWVEELLSRSWSTTVLETCNILFI